MNGFQEFFNEFTGALGSWMEHNIRVKYTRRAQKLLEHKIQSNPAEMSDVGVAYADYASQVSTKSQPTHMLFYN